jgi:hypothetical protein
MTERMRGSIREFPYVLLLLSGCLLYGAALGVFLGEWVTRR